MSRQDLPLNGFTVQALLLLAISIHCNNGFELARSLLDKTTSIALEIGMQFKYFAITHSNGDYVLEESWRRTWWGLYVVDGIFQAIQRSNYFALWVVQADVDLPCEESQYSSENIPEPHSMFQYNEREFSENEASYSSFTYLIDIVRILGSVMAVAGEGGNLSDSLVDDADGCLVNWELHLQENKKDVLRSDGEIDEPLFHAHMLFNVTKVFLHRQRSRLAHSPAENLTKCAPTLPSSEVLLPQRKSY
ncbi:hypothetical protein D0Z07_7331 [Hyphodiscus hymeniophilus]|uniref:Xylanolytic transcriptional activator regulatory domain-containing protein n=1 Tax=Hyphodiscus hymeniophilus TaxID=353542 RepID=A0A9P6VG64_9HELO|nr:hypothetical protein D0Z07_7331 [Hyphodiscus hymeniophilus]